MQREIKFRGKRLDTGEWVYGYLVPVLCHPSDPEAGSLKITWLDAELGWRTEEVDPATVGQYLGLKDMNGIEVYEDDVLRCGPEEPSERIETFGKSVPHMDTLELGWSRNGEYGLIWSKSRNILIEVDAISERYDVVGTRHDTPNPLETSNE